MSKRKHFLREKKYTMSINQETRYLRKTMSQYDYRALSIVLAEGYSICLCHKSSNLYRLSQRMAKRLARERRYK